MSRQPVYYAIFYDVEKPKMIAHAMNKMVSEKTYNNLIDDFEGKEVELSDRYGNKKNYRILSKRTFTVFNTIDNYYFVICDCEKIKDAKPIL